MGFLQPICMLPSSLSGSGFMNFNLNNAMDKKDHYFSIFIPYWFIKNPLHGTSCVCSKLGGLMRVNVRIGTVNDVLRIHLLAFLSAKISLIVKIPEST